MLKRNFRCPEDNAILKDLIKNTDNSCGLVPNCTIELLDFAIETAIYYGFNSVSVFPASVKYVAERVKGTGVQVLEVIDFPAGCGTLEAKLKEAEVGIANGATELDMVMNLNKFFNGDYKYVCHEASEVVKLAAQAGVGVKLIQESGYLTDEQILTACQLTVDAGCEYIKTGTGFGPGRATLHNVGLIIDNFADKIKIKATGGNISHEDNYAFLERGAHRVAGRNSLIDQLKAIGYDPKAV